MKDAIILTLQAMGWLGIVLGILVVVNTICGTLYNITTGQESFSWKKLFKGLGKALIFYISAALLSITFTMLPFINEMITNTFGTKLLTEELLTTLSGVGVLGVVVSTIVVQGKKAIVGILQLANISANTEEITWEVEIPEEEN